MMAAVASAAVGSLVPSVQATPATLGYYPGTDIYGPKAFHFDVDNYGRGVKTDVGNSLGLTGGFGSDTDKAFGRNEVGFDYYTFPNTLSTSKRVIFNFKTQLFADSEKGTRVVAGAWGLGNRDLGAPNVGYLLASKTFGFGRIHVGVARSFQKESIVGNDRTNLHVAYDRAITPKLSFVADYYTGKTTYSVLQPTLYYSVNDKAAFGIGYARYNSSAIAPRNQVYLSFDYNFGGRTASPPATGEPGTPGAAPDGGTPAG